MRAFSEYGLEALVIGFFVHHGQETFVDLLDVAFVFPGNGGVLEEFVEFFVFEVGQVVEGFRFEFLLDSQGGVDGLVSHGFGLILVLEISESMAECVVEWNCVKN
jgi:hypothetical protein